MEKSTQLHIYEEILLLALRDKEGTMLFGVNYPQALAGALLAELLLLKKVEIEASGKRKFVKLANTKSTGNLLLDECIEKMSHAKRRATAQNWIQRFANIRRVKHKAAESLCRKGILKLEEDKVLLIFNRKIYPEVDPRPEKRIMDKIYKAIFNNPKEIDPETVILISICNSTGILRQLFDKSKLREKKNRIKEITSGNLIGKATKDAIEAMQAAVMVATIIPAVTVAATST
jgi:hypothetical protein